MRVAEAVLLIPAVNVLTLLMGCLDALSERSLYHDNFFTRKHVITFSLLSGGAAS